MIEFFSQTDFQLDAEEQIAKWLENTAVFYGKEIGELAYVFCDDERLLEINREFLSHDTLTDIITFDYNLHNQLNGEIYISTDRVKENAQEFKETFEDELHRVMVHGLLHLCGLKDKTVEEKTEMRKAEDRALSLRPFP